MRWFKTYALYFAWVLSLSGLILSFYSSEILGAEPCRLCWYQRCALFPLAFLLGIAVYRNDRDFIRYGLALAGAGVALSLTQVFIPVSLCGEVCVDRTVFLDFLTLPMISLFGFFAIAALLWSARLDELP